jgi:hypothetical protein
MVALNGRSKRVNAVIEPGVRSFAACGVRLKMV